MMLIHIQPSLHILPLAGAFPSMLYFITYYCGCVGFLKNGLWLITAFNYYISSYCPCVSAFKLFTLSLWQIPLCLGGVFLICHIKELFRTVLHLPYPSLRNNHFSENPWVFLVDMVAEGKIWRLNVFTLSLGVPIAPRFFQQIRLRNVCVCVYTSVDMETYV